MAETFVVTIERWPKPESEGGPGGVFEDEMQLAEALGELFRREELGFTGEIHFGISPAAEPEVSAIAVKRGRLDQPDVTVKLGVHQLTYSGGRLEAFTADEFEARFGSRP